MPNREEVSSDKNEWIIVVSLDIIYSTIKGKEEGDEKEEEEKKQKKKKGIQLCTQQSQGIPTATSACYTILTDTCLYYLVK